MTKVAMIGVGKLGQDCAEIMSQQYDVVGYDVETRTPSFPMRYTIQEAVQDRDIIFIAAPTPHDPIYGGETPTSHLPNKDFDYTIVKDILTEVNKHVNMNQLVVLISTVLPGTVRRELKPCLTNSRFIYNPYLIAMGTIKYDMVNPEMVIIGTEDGSVTDEALELVHFYKPLMQNNPRHELGTWEEAESIKIFYNTFISTKVALVNMIQDVAERSGNMCVDVVTGALERSTYRITGPAYMKAGMGDGGACHPRDNIALRYLAEKLDLGYDLFDSIMKAREVQAENMALRCLKNGKNVTIIGKAYKPNVPYTNGSSSMLVGHYIEQHGGNVHYYDVNTGDTDLRPDWTHVYLIGYWDDKLEANLDLPNWSTTIDPWRKRLPKHRNNAVINYGDTRSPRPIGSDDAERDIQTQILLAAVPELAQIQDKLYLVSASCASEKEYCKIPNEYLVAEIEQQLALGKTKFIFDGRAEDFQNFIAVKIHQLLSILKDKVKPSDFYYMSCADNYEQDYEDLVSRFGWTDRIQLVSYQHFKYFARQYVFNLPTPEYVIEPKEKKFVCFNKVTRPHRTILLERMLRADLVKDSFYSFFNFTTDYENWYNNIDNLNENFYSIKANKQLFPLRLNITEERHNPADTVQEDFYYTDNSYFSIVTETTYNTAYEGWLWDGSLLGKSTFFSEKIYKPITMKHPFVLVSRPNSLKFLREHGFKTFHPIINESYDEITDGTLRMEAIANEVERLCSLSTEEWLEIQVAIKDIVDYNYEVLKNKSEFMSASDINKLIGE